MTARLAAGNFVPVDQVKLKFETTLAHPTFYPGGVAVYQSVVRDIPGDDSARANKAVPAQSDTADDGGVGANGSALANPSLAIFILAGDMAARVDHVGENAGGTQEAVVLNDHSGIDGDIVLDLDVVAEDHAGGDDHILA